MRKSSRKNPEVPKISDAEWVVMRVVWDREPATANEVVENLAEKSEVDWKPKTVHTMLRRLVDKGALVYDKRGREFVYRSQVSAADCEHAESQSFLQRVFGGKMAPFLASFVEREDFSEKEVAELKKILERQASAPVPARKENSKDDRSS